MGITYYTVAIVSMSCSIVMTLCLLFSRFQKGLATHIRNSFFYSLLLGLSGGLIGSHQLEGAGILLAGVLSLCSLFAISFHLNCNILDGIAAQDRKTPKVSRGVL